MDDLESRLAQEEYARRFDDGYPPEPSADVEDAMARFAAGFYEEAR